MKMELKGDQADDMDVLDDQGRHSVHEGMELECNQNGKASLKYMKIIEGVIARD